MPDDGPMPGQRPHFFGWGDPEGAQVIPIAAFRGDPAEPEAFPEDLAAKWDLLTARRQEKVAGRPKWLNAGKSFLHQTEEQTLLLRLTPGWACEDAIELARRYPDGLGSLAGEAANVIRRAWAEADAKAKAQAEPKQWPFPVLTPANLTNKQPRPYVVKGLIARGNHIMMMGYPGSGKSVIVPHVAYAVAQGREVFGRRVKAGPVLYIAAEDGDGMQDRVRALALRYGDAPNFHLVPAQVDLMNDGTEREAIESLIAELQPVLIVVDVLTKCFPGLRENEGEDMARVVRVVRDLTRICGSAVWTVHHIAKDGGTTPRGHGDLWGDLDMTMLVEGTRAETRTIRLGKNRNGSSDDTFAFNVEVETLGIDEDGDPETAPIAAEVEGEAPKAGKRLSAETEAWFADLADMFAEPGNAVLRAPAPDLAPVLVLTRDQARQGYRVRGRFTVDVHGALTGTDRGKFRDMLNRLKDNNKISMLNDCIWLRVPRV